MKQPGLGVEPRGRLIVGDANVGAEVAKFIERPRFGRSRVRRRQHPELASRLTVGAERIEHRRDPAAPNEGHDDVDAVGGMDLGQHLVADARLAGRVRQERRVEEWNQWRGNRFCAPIR